MKTKKAYLMILMSALSILNAYSQLPTYVPSNGLVGYWPFNGNANDESGNGNNGTVNGATLTADRNGVANKAYSFDYTTVGFGTKTDEIYIPYSPTFNSSFDALLLIAFS